jgi:CheY-like chemotaxis protein
MRRPKKILVVDDNPINREIIQEVLSDEYDIIMAAEGAEAIALANRHQPRIVLLDVMMPDLDGYEICRTLRAMNGMSDATIIMVTAKAMPSERALGFDAGADGYVTKPFDDAELVAAIRTATSSRSSRAMQESLARLAVI